MIYWVKNILYVNCGLFHTYILVLNQILAKISPPPTHFPTIQSTIATTHIKHIKIPPLLYCQAKYGRKYPKILKKENLNINIKIRKNVYVPKWELTTGSSPRTFFPQTGQSTHSPFPFPLSVLTSFLVKLSVLTSSLSSLKPICKSSNMIVFDKLTVNIWTKLTDTNILCKQWLEMWYLRNRWSDKRTATEKSTTPTY